MRVFMAGVDGYLGSSLALNLAQGHTIAGSDLFSRRKWVAEVGSDGTTPISSMADRLITFRERFGASRDFYEGDLRDCAFVKRDIREFPTGRDHAPGKSAVSSVLDD